MSNSQKEEGPLVPVTKDVHEAVRNPAFEERLEGFMYGVLLYSVPAMLLFLYDPGTFFLTVGIALLVLSYAVFFRHIGRYFAVKRRYGLSFDEYRKASKFPLDFYGLRENEHQERRKRERQNIGHIEEALNNIHYHSVSVEKNAEGQIEIETEEPETTPEEEDPFLSGERNVYSDE